MKVYKTQTFLKSFLKIKGLIKLSCYFDFKRREKLYCQLRQHFSQSEAQFGFLVSGTFSLDLASFDLVSNVTEGFFSRSLEGSVLTSTGLVSGFESGFLIG